MVAPSHIFNVRIFGVVKSIPCAYMWIEVCTYAGIVSCGVCANEIRATASCTLCVCVHGRTVSLPIYYVVHLGTEYPSPISGAQV